MTTGTTRNLSVELPAVGVAMTSRYQVMLGAVIVQLILGTVYGYSIFWQPLQASLYPEVITQAQQAERVAAGQDVGNLIVVADAEAAAHTRAIQQGFLKYAFSICILSFAVVMVVAGRLQDVIGPRRTAMIGAVLMGSGFIIAGLLQHPIVFYLAHAAFTGVAAIVVLMLYHAIAGKLDVQKNPILQYIPMGIVAASVVAGVVLGNQYVGQLGEMDSLFLLWGTVGFLAGAGIGFAYVCPIAALVKWFPKKKGLVSGIAVAGFGFGAYLFKGETIGAVGYIAQHGIVSFFIIHGLVCFVGIMIGAMLLRNPPDTAPAAGVKNQDSNWQDTLRRPAFYVLWLMFFSGAMAGLMVIGIVAPFVKEQAVRGGLAADQAVTVGATAMGILAIFNAVGRIVWGFASDRMGRTAAFVTMFVLQAIVLLALGALDSSTMLYVGAGLVGFNFGGNFALFPSATADLFGAKNLGANYGWVFTSYGIAGVVGIVAGNAAKTMTGSYAWAFTLSAVLCLVAAALAIGLYVTGKRSAAVNA